MLDMISSALDPYKSSRNLSTVRIDGRCTLQQRHDALDLFNDDPNCVILLATIGAMGEGYVLLSAPKEHGPQCPLVSCPSMRPFACLYADTWR